MPNIDEKPRWPTRVRLEKIRRLYETEARGLIDEELLEDVLTSMVLRCQAILTCTAAGDGKVKCIRCGTIIQRLWDLTRLNLRPRRLLLASLLKTKC